jgi:hypothetical protein
MGMARRTALAVAVTVVGVLTVGCGGNGGDADGTTGDVLTVPEAAAYRGHDMVVVEGFVFFESEQGRICEVQAESFPPQCGGAWLPLEGLGPVDFYGLASQGDRFWSDGPVRVRGTVDDGVVTVDTSTP